MIGIFGAVGKTIQAAALATSIEGGLKSDVQHVVTANAQKLVECINNYGQEDGKGNKFLKTIDNSVFALSVEGGLMINSLIPGWDISLSDMDINGFVDSGAPIMGTTIDPEMTLALTQKPGIVQQFFSEGIANVLKDNCITNSAGV